MIKIINWAYYTNPDKIEDCPILEIFKKQIS